MPKSCYEVLRKNALWLWLVACGEIRDPGEGGRPRRWCWCTNRAQARCARAVLADLKPQYNILHHIKHLMPVPRSPYFVGHSRCPLGCWLLAGAALELHGVR
jgi:hypothetical protein